MVKNNIQSKKEKILDFIYPQVCGICGKLDRNWLCPKCRMVIEEHKQIGIDLPKESHGEFQEFISLFSYEGIIRDLLIQYKFQEKPYLAKTLGNFLISQEPIKEKIQAYDILMPVPISHKRKKERGYNQSLLLAKEIQVSTKQVINTQSLVKIQNITEQSKLTKEERKQNIQGVYQLKHESMIKEKSVLIIDDIYTTGSTIKECCKTIAKGKPSKIGILVMAKDELKEEENN